jgi:hypothetical protein
VNGATVFAGSDQGTLFRSFDNGATWDLLSLASSALIDEIYGLAIFDNTVYAGGLYDLYRSKDNGQSWIRFAEGLPLTPTLFSLVAVQGCGIIAGLYELGFYFSNGMSSWKACNPLIDNQCKAIDLSGLQPLGFAIINQDVVYSQVLYARKEYDGTTYGYGGLQRSEGACAQWGDAGDNTGMPLYTSVCALASDGNQTVYLGTTDGIYSGGDFIINSIIPPLAVPHWSKINHPGLPTDQIVALAVCGGYLIAGYESIGIWRCPLQMPVQLRFIADRLAKIKTKFGLDTIINKSLK